MLGFEFLYLINENIISRNVITLEIIKFSSVGNEITLANKQVRDSISPFSFVASILSVNAIAKGAMFAGSVALDKIKTIRKNKEYFNNFFCQFFIKSTPFHLCNQCINKKEVA